MSSAQVAPTASGQDPQGVEGRITGLVESAMDPIITVDDAQCIVMFNAAAEQVFGRPRDAVIGQPLALLIPARFHAPHRDHIERFAKTGVTTRRMGGHRVLSALRADGTEFPIEASISQHEEHGRRLFTVILRDVAERVRAEEEIRRSRDELRELGAAAHLTREHEKSRIARELHDELGGVITMLQMDVAWCKEKLPALDGVAEKLDRMEKLLKSTAATTRRIAADLRPLMLDDLGLPDALDWLVQDFSQRSGIVCKLSIREPLPKLPDAQSTAVFRAIQESLSNIVKHAGASKAEVTIERNELSMTIRVRDNGIGFSPDEPRKPDSYGLLGLRERAALLNGEALISSTPGEGTTVEIRLPLESWLP